MQRPPGKSQGDGVRSSGGCAMVRNVADRDRRAGDLCASHCAICPIEFKEGGPAVFREGGRDRAGLPFTSYGIQGKKGVLAGESRLRYD